MKKNICKKCNKEFSSNDHYCNFCGTPLKEENIKNNGKDLLSKVTAFGKIAYKKYIARLNDKDVKLTDSENRKKAYNNLNLKIKENKLKSGVIIIALLLILLFIFSPAPTSVADDFIEYSAYDQREKAVPLMSNDGIDYMMGMTKEEFETHTDYGEYNNVLQTRISKLTHDVYRQGRELLTYELVSKESIDDGVVLNYQLTFDNSDTVVVWIHLTKEFGRWKVFSFLEQY